MSIYPKRLRNIESLERERKLLLKKRKELDSEEFSVPELFSVAAKEGHAGALPGLLMGMISGQNPIVNTLGKLVQSSGTKKQKTPGPAAEKASTKPESSLLFTVAKEFIGGYLKWKAIELSYKGIKLVIKARRNKKDKE